METREIEVGKVSNLFSEIDKCVTQAKQAYADRRQKQFKFWLKRAKERINEVSKLNPSN